MNDSDGREAPEGAEEEGARVGPGPERNVYRSSRALLRVYGEDGSTKSEELVPRNTYTLTDRLRELDPEAVVGLYLVEDEEQSDPPPEGQERYSMPLLPPETDPDGNQAPSDRIRAVDAIARLAAATTPDRVVLAKLHQHCDHASATSRYDCGVYTMVFGGKPCGFAYMNSCRDVPVSSMALLYETAKSQLESLKESFRRMAPGIRFSDDPEEPAERSGLVLPSGMPVETAGGPVVSPSEASEEAAGLTRIVRIVD